MKRGRGEGKGALRTLDLSSKKEAHRKSCRSCSRGRLMQEALRTHQFDDLGGGKNRGEKGKEGKIYIADNRYVLKLIDQIQGKG